MNANLYAPLRRPDEFGDTEAACSVPPVDTGAHWPDSEPLSEDEREALADCPTVRRFARSEYGVDAAWPRSAEYAQAIEPLLDATERSHRIADRVIAVLCAAVLAALAWGLLA